MKLSRLWVAALFLAAAPLLARETSSTIFSHHFPFGAPQTENRRPLVVIRHLYAASFNTSRLFSDWASLTLDKDTASGLSFDPPPFQIDPWLEGYASYDVAAFRQSPHLGYLLDAEIIGRHDHRDEISLSANAAPMHQSLREGLWTDLAKALNRAAREAPLHITAGPLYEGTSPLGMLLPTHAPHQTPSGFWLAVVSLDDNGQARHMAAFVFPQEPPSRRKLDDFAVSVAEVESRARIKLFPQLPPRFNALKTRVDKDWAADDFR